MPAVVQQSPAPEAHAAAPSPAPSPAVDAAVDAALRARIDAACERACASIAPAWPLDRAIAVNPHWQRIGRTPREVAARLAVLADMHVFPPRDMLRRAWEGGRIVRDDLDAARSTTPGAPPAAQCIDALGVDPRLPRLPLLIDVLDDDPERHARLSWRQAITHQVGQTCAAYFDHHQADWQPTRAQGLYGFWRDSIAHDHGIGLLMGLPELHQRLGSLPATRQDAEHWVLQRLGLPEAVWADYLEAVLLTVQGWASWCAWLGWQARLEGRSDVHLRELLAIRLAWGVVLLECKHDASARQAFSALRARWADAARWFEQAADALRVDEVWQAALEAGYQRDLVRKLGSTARAQPAPAPEVQAVFCIDVRSEPLRRALESVWPAVHTHGFAGFFGLGMDYTPLATQATRPQLPGLLAPALHAGDAIVAPPGGHAPSARTVGAARLRSFALAGPVRAASRWPGAAFSFVESAGVGYLGALARWLWPASASRHSDHLDGVPARYRPLCRPALAGLDAQARVELAQQLLQALGLQQELAPLVLLVGHAAHTANNAHAAALDCGACGGQSGEVNVRALARLLNDPEVRAGLAARGLRIPQQTVFAACLHDTTTDEVEVFDRDLWPAHALPRWQRLQRALEHACDQVRRERAARLGLDARTPHAALLRQLRRRANDGAQTRPEWGLAGNAALLLAPRSRSRGLHLGGRCFLHDYDPALDADGSALERLMTAPMLVAHWINWQYHASTCEPQRLGAGNKLLHNVVGGRIGVFEGNGGDLRIGLPLQSVHDGDDWVHEPLRLSVFIDAPQPRIERVIASHGAVRDLVEREWLHLFRLDAGGGVQRRVPGGGWSAC